MSYSIINNKDESFYQNFTCNASKMFSQAFTPNDRGVIGIKSLDGMAVEVAQLSVADAIVYMLNNKRKLRFLEPKNGWGTLEEATDFLIELLGELRTTNQDGFISVL